MAGKRDLTKLQVVDWNENWSFTDRQFIEHALSRLPDEATIRAHDGCIVAKVGRRAFVVHPGFVYWPKGTWAKDVDGTLIPGGLLVGSEGDGTLWARLSTLRGWNTGGSGTSRTFGFCPIHGLALPANGICDDC